MSGTFLNFFECRLSNDLLQVYVIDYVDHEKFDKLRNEYKDIYFYRYDGNKIYFWKRKKEAIIPEELKGISVHLKLLDYPQIFKTILREGIAQIFKNNSAYVEKSKHSSIIEIHSNKNNLSNIDGLQVKNILLLDSFYSEESKILGITLAFRTKNLFTWNIKEFIEHGIDIRDLKKDENSVFCNKTALNRFLQSTNNEQAYNEYIYKSSAFSEQYKMLKKTYEYIKRNIHEIYIGDDIKVTEINMHNLPYNNDVFKVESLNLPNHYYYSNKTQGGQYHEALKILKPYTYELFSTKKISVFVACPKKYEGTEEVFSIKLKKKLQEIFHVDTEFRKYYFEDVNLQGYRKAIYDEILSKTEKPDIVLIVLEEKQKKLNFVDSPYYFCKAKLIGQGIPSQEILIERIKQCNDFILNNISLNMYGKIGGTAWTIEKIEREKQEFIIGISSCFDKQQRKIFGVSQVFEYNGNYIVTECTPLTTISEYEKSFEDYLRNTLNNVLKNQVINNEVRLIFHINKSPSNKYEIKAINNVIREFENISISYAIVHLNYYHNFRLFNSEGNYKNKKGAYVNLDTNKALLCLTDKSINPLLIDIDKRSTFKDKDYITKQIYWFCHLSFRSFIPSKKTVTMQYPYLISKMTNELKNIDGWDYELLKGIGDKLWFL